MFLGLALAFGFVGYVIKQTNTLARDGAEAKVGLCAYKQDLVQRVSSANDFLVDHPNGFSGIPAAAIKTSIENQRSALRALERVHCGPKIDAAARRLVDSVRAG